jgi:hypothetical protein
MVGFFLATRTVLDLVLSRFCLNSLPGNSMNNLDPEPSLVPTPTLKAMCPDLLQILPVGRPGSDCVEKKNGSLPAREKNKRNTPTVLIIVKASAMSFVEIIQAVSCMATGPQV